MNGATIRLLAAKGLSAIDIAEVADAMEAENKRSAAAERQARYRARKKAEAADGDVTSDVTCDVTGNDEAPLSLSPNDNNSNPHTHTPEHTPRARKGDNFPCPEWCEADVWRDLKANRKTKRLTNTPTAHRQFVAAIERMADDDWPPGRIVEAIAAKGWGGPHDPRDDRKPGNDNRKSDNRTTRSAAQRALSIIEGRSHQ